MFELLAADEGNLGEEELVHEQQALKQCLGKLDPTQRESVLTPYRGHGAVSDLAEDSGRSVNSLYKKIGRLREKLTVCVERQLENTNGLTEEMS